MKASFIAKRRRYNPSHKWPGGLRATLYYGYPSEEDMGVNDKTF